MSTLTTYIDAHGFDPEDARLEIELRYGKRVADWPNRPLIKNRNVCATMHALYGSCWECGNRPVEAHHIIGGARKSDQMFNIAMLCRHCHLQVKTSKLPQARILYLKWKHDRQHCDWVRLMLLAKRFLEVAA